MRLENWERVWVSKEQGLSYLTGLVYDDTKGRFYDGQVIHTSLVEQLTDDKVYTLNSVYELGKKL